MALHSLVKNTLYGRVFGLTFALFISPLPCIAKTASEIAEVARSASVLVEGATEGSGVLVDRRGEEYTVLTAWHVINGNRLGEEIVIKTPDGASHKTSIVNARRIGNVDMAAITFKSSKVYKPVEIGSADKISQGAKIYVAGFPLSTTAVPVRIMRFLPGQVIAYSPAPLPDGYQILYTNRTLPGMSGGAVINSFGLLVGIHGRGETDFKATEQSGVSVKTGTNLALPINLYGTLSRKEDSVLGRSNTSVRAVPSATPMPGGTSSSRFDEYLVAAANTSSLLFRERMTLNDPRIDQSRAREVIRLSTLALQIKPSAKAYELRGAARKAFPMYRITIPLQISVDAVDQEIALQKLNAVDDFSNAIRLDPKNASLYIQRGSAESDRLRSRRDYRTAIRLEPNTVSGYIALLGTYTDKRERKLVIDEMMTRVPSSSDAYVAYGDYIRARSTSANPSLKRENTLQSITAYEKARDLDPNNWEPYWKLASSSSFVTLDGSLYEKYYLNSPEYCSYDKDDCLRYRIGYELMKQGIGSPGKTIDLVNKALPLAPDAPFPMAQLYALRTMAKSRLNDIVGACRDWKLALRYDKMQGSLEDYCK
ncbi:serine protease [Synechococcus sp. LTW-R]|uniref:S1 family peptidase n=1 Tax=Synechococcus sp. LTW-R TaxID=2751170 RepID=UPI00162A5EBE|nr:serine protease [Synechococcus sp. LTW-R]QNG30613.1 trypsin-like peptidase domain-containing protein [Synechococcus sp. LTW-R]